jgi:cytochrome c oxidase cbb3-type subunit I/II
MGHTVRVRGEESFFSFDNHIVRLFALATMFWGFVGILLGVAIALQLAHWPFNFDTSWITFGRLRPLHTNATIFAFAGNAIFMGIYHSTQRLLKTRMASDVLSRLHFWGWQLVIVVAAITLPLGITTGKEYAELEWPIDILITVVWVIFAINFFWTLIKRREKHIYVAIWFYIATIVTVALLHIVNSMELPVTLPKSYSMYAGVSDALVQWWYGHNAVAFFLTTPFLGLMYYYVPKAINRPIYSYRLSIIHFWSLVFIYIWAGPHHLLYSTLPDWAQTFGMVFSIMLIAPSWGGMINGLLTMRGAWDRVRKDPVLKMMVLALTCYGMATFEGPLLSIKSVNALAHFSDWIIGHVHIGTLGWNGFLTFAILYYVVPKLWRTPLYSEKLANVHFWIGTAGIVFYVVSMWTSGITQGLMLRAISGGQLLYPDFIETVVRIQPLYYIRALGGVMYLIGFLIMVYNLARTIRAGAVSDETVRAVSNVGEAQDMRDNTFHRNIEGMPIFFAVLTVGAVLAGSFIEILPSLTAHVYVKPPARYQPYTPLELTGRDIYIREGCYTCHSQMVRPLVADQLRYGERSHVEESYYDHPFQWGSRRTGPDLARIGGKYPDLWHFRHMRDPRDVTPKSIMPNYPWLYSQKWDAQILTKKLVVMRRLGVPYSENDIAGGVENAQTQARQIAQNLQQQGARDAKPDREIMALIAYLQRLKYPEEGVR